MKKKIKRIGCMSLAALMAASSVPALGLHQTALAASADHAILSAAAVREWEPGKLYQIGDQVSHQGLLYQCRQSHTTLPGWEPNIVPALWLEIGKIPSEKPDIVPVSSIVLSKSALTLKEKESIVLTAKINPENATDKVITWSSSNSAIVSVKDGHIQAKAPGTAIITAKAGDKTATCTVTVKKDVPKEIQVTSISINSKDLTMTTGDSIRLQAKVLPANATNKKVTWTCDNEKVISIQNGHITAVGAGTAVITATAGSKSDSIRVLVEEKVVPTDPEPTAPTPTDPEPSTPAPTDPEPSTPSPTDPEPTTPAPTDPEPSTPAPDPDHTQPPVPFWKNYKNYANKDTEVYYKGNIYKNKWYANAGFTPGQGDPWTLVGPAEWTVKEDPKNYEKDTGATQNSINKVLTDEEIKVIYGGIKPEYSPEAALNRLDELIPESSYNELFPYRFGSPQWKAAPSTKNYYPNADELPDYYSYQNLKKAVSTLSNTIIKVEWYEGAEWCYRLIRFDKTTKEQKLIYSDAYFEEEWLQTKIKHIAVCDYGSFLAEGDLNTRKRELAGFLANISHETGGGSVDGLTDDSKSGLYFNEEVGFIGSSAIGYVQGTGTSYLPVAGKSYHGRGPIQLSYNYNYGLCSDVLYGDSSILLNNPDLVEQDGVLGFMTGIWFWMTPQPPKPSCHQVITGTWKPNPGAPNEEFNGNFGLTIIIINNEGGQSEHGTGAVARRAKYYRIFSDKMNADITGEHCDTMGMGTFTQTK